MKKIMKYFVIAVVVVLIIIAGYWYDQHSKLYPSTDDAYVQADVVNVAAQVSGPVASINTQDFAEVKKGQLLFSIDPEPFMIAVNEAKANLENTQQQIASLKAQIEAAKAEIAERQAQLTQAEKTANRADTLVKEKLQAQSVADQADSDLAVAKAALSASQNNLLSLEQQLGDPNQVNAAIKAAQGKLAQAQLNLTYTKIYAPSSGTVVNFNLRVGSMITAQQTYFALIENHSWWVDANYKETDLSRIRPGQTAKIIIDMYPNHRFQGEVESISTGSGAAFSLLPPENATGNWVKVTQRFPVKVKILNLNPKFPLRMGATASVVINTQ